MVEPKYSPVSAIIYCDLAVGLRLTYITQSYKAHEMLQPVYVLRTAPPGDVISGCFSHYLFSRA